MFNFSNPLRLRPRQAHIYVILLTEILCLGMTMASLPEMKTRFFGSRSKAVLICGMFDAGGAFLAFFVAPAFGLLSDRHGRKPFLLISTLCASVPIWALSLDLNLWYYLYGRLIGCISVFGLCYAAMSDLVHDVEKRALAYGYMLIVVLPALVVGPAFNLVISRIWVFRIAGIFSVLTLLFIAFVMPETLHYKPEDNEEDSPRASLLAPEGTLLAPETRDVSTESQVLFGDSSSLVPSCAELPAPRTAGTIMPIVPPNYGDPSMDQLPAAWRQLPGAESDDLVANRNVNGDRLSSSLPHPSVFVSSLAVAPVLAATTTAVGVSHRHKNNFDRAQASTRSRPRSASSHLTSLPAEAHIGAESVAHDMGKVPPSKLVRQGSYNPFVAIKYLFKTRTLVLIAVMLLFEQMAENGLLEVILFYLQDVLHFTSRDNTISLMITGALSTVALLVVYPFLLRKTVESNILALAIAFNLVRLTVYCFVNQKWQAWTLSSLAGFAFMSYPAASSIVARHVSQEEQGLGQGAVAGIRGLTQGLAPLLFSSLFSYFTSKRAPVYLPQSPLILACILLFIALVLSRFLPRPSGAATVADSAAKDAEVEHNIEYMAPTV